LETASQRGEFRYDLYHRIKVFTIELVPLRNRPDDIPVLVDYYLKKYTAELNAAPKKLTKTAIKLLETYRWPGNIRELSNAIRSAIVMADGDIDVEHLPTSIHFSQKPSSSRSTPADDSALKDVMKKVEREHIEKTLEKTGWDRAEAAELLGIDEKNLQKKIKEHGITKP
jgi:DNA-binding NtrC family response regulator